MTALSRADSGEHTRLAEVARYHILDTPPDGAFDRIAALAARLLDAPIATVSIVDSDRVWFKAAHGLEGVTQVDREPGLCSSAIMQDAPYVVADALTDPRTAANSLVHGEMGVRGYAAAPITTMSGERLGTVNVLDTRPREFTSEDTATLADLASVVMDQLEVRLSALTTLRHERQLRERAEQDAATIESFATTLQRTLLPPELPHVPGLELACHYYAASTSHVTGDFYDVFPMGDGRWGFFLGDVTGHGTAAATVTSLARYTLRAAALYRLDPASGLADLNTALLLDKDVSQLCTALFGILDTRPDGGFDLTIAGGGHPPALWLRPDGVAEIYPRGGMLLGAMPDARFVTRQVHLAPGDGLLLYTDGLTEARPGGAFFGEDGLVEFVGTRPRSARQLIDALTALIEGFDPPPTDDVALLAMSVPKD